MSTLRELGPGLRRASRLLRRAGFAKDCGSCNGCGCAQGPHAGDWLPGCTGVAASWCPRCGDCTCGRTEDGDWDVRLYVEDTGAEYTLPYVDLAGARHYPSPPDLTGTGLVRRPVGMLECPLHAPDSPHAEPTEAP